MVFRNMLGIQHNIQCTVYTTKYTVCYIEYRVYTRIFRIYIASETEKAGLFVDDMYSRGLCVI